MQIQVYKIFSEKMEEEKLLKYIKIEYIKFKENSSKKKEDGKKDTLLLNTTPDGRVYINFHRK